MGRWIVGDGLEKGKERGKEDEWVWVRGQYLWREDDSENKMH